MNRETDQQQRKTDKRSGLPHVVIQEQLQRILTHPEFQATEKIRDFLQFVVEETLAGRAGQLKGFTIANAIYSRGPDFDAAHDPIVRIQAGRLRRAMERYYLVAGGNDLVYIHIPKGTYVPVFSANRQTAASKGAGGAPGRTPATVGDWPSVIVRPFRNLSSERELDYLGDGLAVELCSTLSRYPDIRVLMARDPRPVDAVRYPEARFEITGSVRHDSESTKVVVQLIDTENRELLWTDSVNVPRESEMIIEFQENAANVICAEIASYHGVVAKTLRQESGSRPPSELTTYQAILKGYAYDLRQSFESYMAAFEALQAAYATDTESGLLPGMLAHLYADNIMLEFLDLSLTPIDEGLKLARQAALAEPENQFSLLALARLRRLNNERDEALADVRAALALNPDSLMYMDLIGYYLVLLGEWDIGTAMIRKAIQLNPYYRPYVHYGIWLDLVRRADYRMALEELEPVLGSGDFWGPLARAATLGQLGRLEEGREAIKDLLVLKPNIADRGRLLIGHSVKDENVSHNIIEGLAKAGLKLTG